MTEREPVSDRAGASKTDPPTSDFIASVGGSSVGAAMRPGLMTCSPRASLFDVARLMASSGVHAVVVWGDEETDAEGIWGVISDSDFIVAAARGVQTAQSAVGVAGARVVRVEMDESLAAAADLMAANQVTHLIVISEREHPIGILSALDIARAATQPAEGDRDRS